MKPIPYGRQYISEEDIAAVTEALRHDYLTTGPTVGAFEEKFAEYIGSGYAVAVSNGTAALHLCALALGVNNDSHVITSPITFAATANCVKYCGGHIHFADINPENGLIDIDNVRQLLETCPKGFFSGIIPISLAGFPVNLEQIRQLADLYDLWIIEDACHAPGGWFTDSAGIRQNCGNGVYADLSIFSFHPVKHIASGEGGMITTNDFDLYERLKILRTHGITRDPKFLRENHGGWYYEMQWLGYNYRIPDILCALGISQLSRAETGMNRRHEIARRYTEAFSDIDAIQTPEIPQGIFHAYHLYVIRVDNRKELYDYLRSKKIFTQVHYIPIHTLPYYRSLEEEEISLPNAEHYYAHCLSIPMYPSLSDEQQEYVINTITQFFS